MRDSPLPFSAEHRRFDAVIIGAGVAGAMSALLCVRAGLKTLLVDRQRFPRHKICGCCINGRAQNILHHAGLADRLQEQHPIKATTLRIQYRRSQLPIAMPQMLALSRRSLDQALIDAAVASGCTFVDEVSATVQPLQSDAQQAGDSSGLNTRLSAAAEMRTVALRTRAGATERSMQTPTDAMHIVERVATVSAAVVLACDGLGHPSLQRLHGFQSPAEPNARIGLGAVLPRMPQDDWLTRGEILMAVARFGYVGVVDIEDQQLNLAAAIDPAHLHCTRAPLASLRAIFEDAGCPSPAGLAQAAMKGTAPLTRRATRIVGQRLLLVGDATGYVEPFTGEGIAWALSGATAVVPLVTEAVRHGWSTDLERRWQSAFAAIIRREQRLCHLLSAMLKRPWLLPPILATCRLFPPLTRRLVRQINRVPEALEHSLVG